MNILLINTLTNGIFMLVTELFEDAWSGANNAWHNQGQDDQWHGTTDMWHSTEQGSGMVEDFNVANIVTNENTATMSDIITARELMGKAVNDPRNEKHMYFEFLKHELNSMQSFPLHDLHLLQVIYRLNLMQVF